MKTKKTLAIILLIFVVIFFLQSSCKTVEKSAVACPDISLKKNTQSANRHKITRNKTLFASKSNNSFLTLKRPTKHKGYEIKKTNNSLQNPSTLESFSNLNKIEYSQGLVASADNFGFKTVKMLSVGHMESIEKTNVTQPIKCDTIILKSDAILIGKVEEIGQTEIKYRKCNNLTGPIISLPSSAVASIHYSNGTSDIIGSSETYAPIKANPVYINSPVYNQNVKLKTEGFGLAGFISGLVGLFVASIPLGLAAIIFGWISLSRIRRYPQRYKGRGFAIASVVLGIVDVVVMIALLAATS